METEGDEDDLVHEAPPYSPPAMNPTLPNGSSPSVSMLSGIDASLQNPPKDGVRRWGLCRCLERFTNGRLVLTKGLPELSPQ